MKSSLLSNKLGMHSFPLGNQPQWVAAVLSVPETLDCFSKKERSPGHYTAILGKIIVLIFRNILFSSSEKKLLVILNNEYSHLYNLLHAYLKKKKQNQPSFSQNIIK